MRKLLTRITRLCRRARPRHAAEPTLLRAYVTSLMSLMLCAAMFLGTTYAWFSAGTTSSTNEIYIGTLSVGLYKLDGTNRLDLADSNNKVFDGTILWEPGYTAIETVCIENNGNLAYKYLLGFTDGRLADDSAMLLDEVARCFDVWVYPHQQGNAPAATDYAAITAVGSGWAHAGTLDTLLKGTPVLTGEADQLHASDTYTIALHMQEDATADVMGQTISLSVKLLAYQHSSEQDGFGNNAYDRITVVSDAAGLVSAVQNAADGDVIAVSGGVYDLTATPLVIDKAITLQAANPEVMPVLQFVTNDSGPITHGIEIKADNVTIKDLTLTADPAGDSSGNLLQISPNGDEYYSDITIDGCTFSGSDHCIATYGHNVTVRNCVLDGSTADDQGNLLYVWGTSGVLTVEDNLFVGNAMKKHGISFYRQSAASAVSGNIRIAGNTFKQVYKAIVHEHDMPYTDVTVEVIDNQFTECRKKPVAIDKGTYLSYTVGGNVFLPVAEGTVLLENKAGAIVIANDNYWNSDNPDWSAVISGDKVEISTYYTDQYKVNKETKGG